RGCAHGARKHIDQRAARHAAEVAASLRGGPRDHRGAVVGPGATRKGGAADVIIWQTGTAGRLPRLIRGRTSGPVFLTERRARTELPPGDIDPSSGRARLSYEQAEALFRKASGGATLHQLRHSALTHDAEDGTSTPVLMARSGHTSVRSLVRYARVSEEALARHHAMRDPARRRPTAPAAPSARSVLTADGEVPASARPGR